MKLEKLRKKLREASKASSNVSGETSCGLESD
jgi:hypothetical protein